MSTEHTRADLDILQRIFAAEIENRLPAQFKSKRLADLQEKGLVQPMRITMSGRPPITVEGWALTHYGRMIYCQSCADEVEGENSDGK